MKDSLIIKYIALYEKYRTAASANFNFVYQTLSDPEPETIDVTTSRSNFPEYIREKLKAEDPMIMDFHIWVTLVRLHGHEVKGWP